MPGDQILYMFSADTVRRALGETMTHKSAYAGATSIRDLRTGMVHNFSSKQGCLGGDVLLPPGSPQWAKDPAALWNAAEKAERRKNSVSGREIIVALAPTLTLKQQFSLVRRFARHLVRRHKVAVEFRIHAPSPDGDQRNFHAHILISARRLGPDGFGEKAREWDVRQTETIPKSRALWADIQNRTFEALGWPQRVDHRSYRARGIDRQPQRHDGPAITEIKRRERAEIDCLVARIACLEAELAAEATAENAAQQAAATRQHEFVAEIRRLVLPGIDAGEAAERVRHLCRVLDAQIAAPPIAHWAAGDLDEAMHQLEEIRIRVNVFCTVFVYEPVARPAFADRVNHRRLRKEPDEVINEAGGAVFDPYVALVWSLLLLEAHIRKSTQHMDAEAKAEHQRAAAQLKWDIEVFRAAIPNNHSRLPWDTGLMFDARDPGQQRFISKVFEERAQHFAERPRFLDILSPGWNDDGAERSTFAMPQ